MTVFSADSGKLTRVVQDSSPQDYVEAQVLGGRLILTIGDMETSKTMNVGVEDEDARVFAESILNMINKHTKPKGMLQGLELVREVFEDNWDDYDTVDSEHAKLIANSKK